MSMNFEYYLQRGQNWKLTDYTIEKVKTSMDVCRSKCGEGLALIKKSKLIIGSLTVWL